MRKLVTLFSFALVLLLPYLAQAQLMQDADRNIMRLRTVCNAGQGGPLVVSLDIKPRIYGGTGATATEMPSCAPGEYLEDGAAVLDVHGERPSIVSHTGEDSALPAFDIDGDGFPEFIGCRGVGGTAFPTLVRMFPRYAPLATACCRF